MDTTNGSNLPKKPGRPKGLPKTGGRVKGKLPPMGKNFREVLRNLIAIDDEAVVRLKQINGNAVAARERLWQTLHGLRPATTQEFLAVMKFCADYGLGTPTKMTADVVRKEPLLFVSRFQHLPWCWAVDSAENNGLLTDQLKQGQHICSSEAPADQVLTGRAGRSAEMLKAGDAQRALEAAGNVIEPEPAKDEETLEAVIPLPPDDPSAYR